MRGLADVFGQLLIGLEREALTGLERTSVLLLENGTPTTFKCR